MTPVERARSLIGAPFRPQGRDPKTGLDCLGLVEACFGLKMAITARDGRGVSPTMFERMAIAHFSTTFDACDGDLIVMRSGRHWHFGVSDGDALIHADVRARRIVRRRGAYPMTFYARLRWRGESDFGHACSADGR